MQNVENGHKRSASVFCQATEKAKDLNMKYVFAKGTLTRINL